MLTKRIQADGSIKFEDERGKLVLQRLRPGVVLCSCIGYVKVDFFQPLRKEMDREFDLAEQYKQPLVFIIDGWELTGVDTKFREWVELWLKCHRHQIASIVVLLSSKLVVMAANLVSLVIGGGLLKIHSEPQEFKQAIEQCAPGLQWRPPAPGRRDTISPVVRSVRGRGTPDLLAKARG